MKICMSSCILKEKGCDQNKCRYWMNFEEDHNCSLISVEKNGSMTLREIADRLGVTYVRIKQIEDLAKSKIARHSLE